MKRVLIHIFVINVLCIINCDLIEINENDGTCAAGDIECNLNTPEANDQNRFIHQLRNEEKAFLEQIEEKIEMKKMETKILRQKQNIDSEEYLENVTKIMRTVYGLIRANVPLSVHPTIMSLQRENGVNFEHSDFDEKTAADMTATLSRHAHTIILEHLVSASRPISLIIDRFVYVKDGQQYLVLYFVSVEVNNPVLYFYSLIPYTLEDTASEIFDKIMKKFDHEKVDIKSHLKENLMELVTDGTSDLMKEPDGLIQHFRDFIQRPFYSVRFLAHKIHLAVIRPFEAVDYFGAFERNMKSLFSFYNEKPVNRKVEVRRFLADCRAIIHDVEQVNDVDWIISDLSLLKQIRDFWPVLIADLDQISLDNSVKSDNRAEAAKIVKQLKGKHFLLILNFLIDIVDQLKYWSSRVQQRAGLLIEFSSMYDESVRSFEALKVKTGKSTQSLLNQTTCVDINSACSTFDNYYNSKSVIYDNIELFSDADAQRLNAMKEKFLNELIAEITSYFPAIDLKIFAVFNPKNLPRNGETEELESHGRNEIKLLCTFFGWNECENYQNDWTNLLRSIVKNKNYTYLRTNTPYVFWSKILSMNELLSMTQRSKAILHTVLAFSVGSADIERGYNTINDIQLAYGNNKLRFELLDMLTRIIMNGPRDIEKFKAKRYAKAWLLEQRVNGFEEVAYAEQKNI